MDRDNNAEEKNGDAILADVIERLIEMHNRLGHELIAVQAVCAYLIAKQCGQTSDPIASVQEAATVLSATGVALADRFQNSGRSSPYDTRGATDAFERIASMAEQNVLASPSAEIRPLSAVGP